MAEGAEGRKTTPGMCTSQDPTVNPSSVSFLPRADSGCGVGGLGQEGGHWVVVVVVGCL